MKNAELDAEGKILEIRNIKHIYTDYPVTYKQLLDGQKMKHSNIISQNFLQTTIQCGKQQNV
jgi:hypothetical protein